jgi:uncharacterized protein (TIGR03083 family)
MTVDARISIAAMRRSHDELAAQVGAMERSVLEGPSWCSEWTVAAVLGHLGSGAEIGLATLTSGKADMKGAGAVWDRWNAMSPAEQAAESVASDERLVEGYEALDDAALAERQLDLAFLPAPVDLGFAVAMRLSEVGLHRWDIDVVSDPAATVQAYLVPAVLEVLTGFASFFARPTGRTGTVGIEISDPDRSFVLELGEAGVTLAEGVPAESATTVKMPAEAFLRLISGRLAADHTPATITVEGDITLDDLRRTFPGY